LLFSGSVLHRRIFHDGISVISAVGAVIFFVVWDDLFGCRQTGRMERFLTDTQHIRYQISISDVVSDDHSGNVSNVPPGPLAESEDAEVCRTNVPVRMSADIGGTA